MRSPFNGQYIPNSPNQAGTKNNDDIAKLVAYNGKKMDSTLSHHIDASSGKPRIAGTRVRVQDVVACHEFQGMSPDEIAAGYPQITLADVYAALAFYHDHCDELRKQMKDDETFVARFREEYLDRHNGKDADASSLPPR